MASSSNYRPKQLSLGPLEQEILNIVWNLETATVKVVHEQILADPERELAYTSVTTVLNRLTKKGWLRCEKNGRAFTWIPLISRQQANAIKAYDQLHGFLSVSSPDTVAAFADQLDTASIERLEAIANRLKTIRQQREG
ncbi:MAG: BlaI/MecI/CopY family transcriptional regulator [Microcystaceae cyanobacterium]